MRLGTWFLLLMVMWMAFIALVLAGAAGLIGCQVEESPPVNRLFAAEDVLPDAATPDATPVPPPDAGWPDAHPPYVRPYWPECGLWDCDADQGILCCDPGAQCLQMYGSAWNWECCTKYQWWKEPGRPCRPYCQRVGQPMPPGYDCTP